MKNNIANPIIFNDKKFDRIENVSNRLMLTWVLNNICTNACYYCPEDLHNGKNHHYDWNIAYSFLEECFLRYNAINCSISGGEPSISPFFKELVSFLYEKNSAILLTTNLAKTVKFWDNISSNFCSISTSYHPEYMNDKSECEFLEKIEVCSKYTAVNVRVMMSPYHWDKCVRFYDHVANANLNVSLEAVKILPNFGVGKNFCEIEYSIEQENTLKNMLAINNINYCNLPDSYIELNNKAHIFDENKNQYDFTYEKFAKLYNSQQLDFNGWQCSIGKESLFIHYNGRVQRGNCAVGGLIGSIQSGINWPQYDILCNKNICHCAADVFVSKKIRKQP